MSNSDGFLSLKETAPKKFKSNTTVKIDIKGKTQFKAETPGGRHTLALYANVDLPPAKVVVNGKKVPNPQRKALHNGGVRVWFQQVDKKEADGRDETGYDGPWPLPQFGDQRALISHVWPHTVDADAWEFCVLVYAFDDNGNPVDVPLTLSTREIKIISR